LHSDAARPVKVTNHLVCRCVADSKGVEVGSPTLEEVARAAGVSLADRFTRRQRQPDGGACGQTVSHAGYRPAWVHRELVEVLMHSVETQQGVARRVVLESELIVRESSVC
jgi:hypothetical protein